jgi:Ca-activated chloride channel family protein
VQFLHPQILIFLLIPLTILAILIITNKNSLNINFSKESIKKLLALNSGMSQTHRNIFIFISLILMIVALARPVMPKESIDIDAKLTPLVILLDLSKSMKATDLYPNRLEVAKKKIDDILNSNRELLISVVVFAKESYLLSPLSKDSESIKFMLKNFYNNSSFAEGSNILSALNSANRVLKDYENRNIIILSDGGDKLELNEELEYLKANNLKLYSIAVATKKGSPIKDGDNYLTDSSGNIVNLTLNEAIKDLSINSGGAYIESSYSNSDVTQILNSIDDGKESLSYSVKVYKELFYYPLILAFLSLFPIYYSTLQYRKKRAK